MHRKKSKLANAILFTLEKTTWAGTALYDFAYYNYRYLYSPNQNIDRYEFYQAIKRLRDQGFIEKIQDIDQDKIILRITSKGLYQTKIEKALTAEKWDGKWRLVIFDIPESKRRLRNTLRQKLKGWGFKYWQKSLWASKKDVAEPLRDFIGEIGISDWVLVVVADDVGSNKLYTNV